MENTNVSSYLLLSQEGRDPSLKFSVCFVLFPQNLIFLLWLLYNCINSISYSALSVSVSVVHVKVETKYSSENQSDLHLKQLSVIRYILLIVSVTGLGSAAPVCCPHLGWMRYITLPFSDPAFEDGFLFLGCAIPQM